jgi:hypothetical protein
MNRSVEMSPWCIACGFLAFAVVMFLVVHPLTLYLQGAFQLGHSLRL